MPESFSFRRLERKGDDRQSSERYLQVLHYKKYYLHTGLIENYFFCTLVQRTNTDIQAIDSVGVPPLPIPNREVKPNSADGTAKICGRVGHRRFFRKDFLNLREFFLFYAVL